MQEELESPVQIGQVLATKYRVDRILGVGGMGVVVAATHLQLDQLVALKFIRREALMNSEVVARFEREARAAVRLKSEHVARILDVGRLTSGSPYIVMEYLQGQDLAALLQQHGRLPVAMACDLIIQACDAIAEAHSLGIVHRDLKPGNLFLATTSHGRESVKVLDFGISKSHALASEANVTRTQAVMGSPGYMSPEQMRSTKNVDGRADIWSLGIILYELVVGRLPFHADTFTALCLKIAMDPLPPLSALPADIPAGFQAVVQRALEKDPAQRYATAVELAKALAAFASPLYRDRAYQLVNLAAPGAPGAHAAATIAAPRKTPTTLQGASGEAVRTERIVRTRRVALTAAAASCAAGLLAIAVLAGRGAGHAASQPQPAVHETTEQRAPDASSVAVPAPSVGAPAPSVGAPAPSDAVPVVAVSAPSDVAVQPVDAGVAIEAARPRDAAVDKPRPRTQREDPYRSPD